VNRFHKVALAGCITVTAVAVAHDPAAFAAPGLLAVAVVGLFALGALLVGSARILAQLAGAGAVLGDRVGCWWARHPERVRHTISGIAATAGLAGVYLVLAVAGWTGEALTIGTLAVVCAGVASLDSGQPPSSALLRWTQRLRDPAGERVAVDACAVLAGDRRRRVGEVLDVRAETVGGSCWAVRLERCARRWRVAEVSRAELDPPGATAVAPLGAAGPVWGEAGSRVRVFDPAVGVRCRGNGHRFEETSSWVNSGDRHRVRTAARRLARSVEAVLDEPGLSRLVVEGDVEDLSSAQTRRVCVVVAAPLWEPARRVIAGSALAEPDPAAATGGEQQISAPTNY
jgi:hypothetical protein